MAELVHQGSRPPTLFANKKLVSTKFADWISSQISPPKMTNTPNPYFELIEKLCLPTFQNQIALYSPCRRRQIQIQIQRERLLIRQCLCIQAQLIFVAKYQSYRQIRKGYYKDNNKDKDMVKAKCLKDPSYFIFEKQGVQEIRMLYSS